MPERCFVTADLKTLSGTIIPALEKALYQGAMEELRNSHTGFLIKTGQISQSDLKLRYKQARYEAYLRAAADTSPDAAANQAQWTNPYLEAVRTTRTRYTFS